MNVEETVKQPKKKKGKFITACILAALAAILAIFTLILFITFNVGLSTNGENSGETAATVIAIVIILLPIMIISMVANTVMSLFGLGFSIGAVKALPAGKMRGFSIALTVLNAVFISNVISIIIHLLLRQLL